MTEPGEWDALFVIHRCIPTDLPAIRSRRSGLRRILIVTTHQCLPHERAAFAGALHPAKVEFRSLADMLDDRELAAIDAGATAALGRVHCFDDDYIDRYQTLTVHLKNAAVREKLRGVVAPGRIHVADGLGVSAGTWLDEGATRLGPRAWRATLRRSSVGRMLAGHWLRRQFRPPTALVIDDAAGSHLFWGSVRRLQLRPGTVAQARAWPEALAIPGGVVAVALHDYVPAVHRPGKPVQVVVDSYLPSNYPRSYLDAYGNVTFVCPDPFSARWLRSHGRPVVRPPAFIAPAEFAPCVAAPLPIVVLLLNHTGDWVALINRSDTDRLVAGFADLARAFPSLTFIVRPHPGMDHRRHEGAGARARLQTFVDQCRLANLSVSTESLPSDLARGGLFLSEYSTTLIEAWQAGKPGLAVNLTGRRSFMQDFAELGFPHVETITDATAAIARFADAPDRWAGGQSAAGIRYNDLMHAHLAP